MTDEAKKEVERAAEDAFGECFHDLIRRGP
jgi:hypothetical protein